MNALNRKLVRELARLKAQLGSIALVVAAGILMLVTMRGGYEALVRAQDSYYRDTHFADVWSSLERAPNSVASRIERIPGVANVTTRVTFPATLDLPGLQAPGTGLFVSLPSRGRPEINDLHLVRGRLVVSGPSDEVLISENFGLARGLQPGDTVRAVLNGQARDLVVAGWAISPEHSYAVPPGALFPEDDRYGILWMREDVLSPVYDMEGAFNDVTLTLGPGADLQTVLTLVDRVLEPYGGLGAYARADQPSHQILQGELDQNRVMGTAIPVVFLGVAAFLLNLVLTRLIATQRTEIAVLKAFGYRNLGVALHFLTYALAAVAVGAVLGALGGAWLGGAYVGLYAEYFDFPGLEYRLSPMLLAIATGVAVVAAGGGALTAVSRAAKLPPAQAMRPEPPLRFEPGWIERAGLGRRLPSAGRMILRNVERRPARTAGSALGVAFSVAILVISMFMFEGVDYMMDLQFRVIQREDLTVTFERPLDASVSYDLARLDGVTRVETFLVTPARLSGGHIDHETAIQALDPDGRMRRVMTAEGRVYPVPANGLVLSRWIADELKVEQGDPLRVQLLQGRRDSADVRVAAVIDDFLGGSAYMHPAALRTLTRESAVASGAYLAVRRDALGQVNERLKQLPTIAGVASPARMLASFRSQLAESLFISVGFIVGFASIISIGVIYNGARISLSERGRELASLRVMGFRRHEVAVLLLGEQGIITLLAIPLGWILGYALSFVVVTALQTELFRIPLIVGPRTYALSAVVTLLAAAASAWLVRRRIDRLDLIAVLKTRE